MLGFNKQTKGGKGIIEQFKFKAIAPYKYSIAIENSVIPGYFTEKIRDCFLTLTMRVYYGCPDITDYFDEKSFVSIDIDDYKASILKIEEIIESNLYENSLEFIRSSKEKTLNNYHIFPAIVDILEKNLLHADAKKTKNVIKPEHLYNREKFIIRLMKRAYHGLAK